MSGQNAEHGNGGGFDAAQRGHAQAQAMQQVVDGTARLPPAEVPRKARSLGTLCENFLGLYCQQPSTIVHVDNAAKQLQVERRRIYDILNVLHGFGLFNKHVKSQYEWQGLAGLPNKLSALHAEVPPNETSAQPASDDRKERSMSRLTQRFAQMFMTSPVSALELDEAASALLGPVEGAEKNKTKVRRLYDIANIMSAIGMIEKSSSETGKTWFRWCGADGIAARITAAAQQVQLQNISVTGGAPQMQGADAMGLQASAAAGVPDFAAQMMQMQMQFGPMGLMQMGGMQFPMGFPPMSGGMEMQMPPDTAAAALAVAAAATTGPEGDTAVTVGQKRQREEGGQEEGQGGVKPEGEGSDGGEAASRGAAAQVAASQQFPIATMWSAPAMMWPGGAATPGVNEEGGDPAGVAAAAAAAVAAGAPTSAPLALQGGMPMLFSPPGGVDTGIPMLPGMPGMPAGEGGAGTTDSGALEAYAASMQQAYQAWYMAQCQMMANKPQGQNPGEDNNNLSGGDAEAAGTGAV